MKDFITRKRYSSEWTYDELPLASQVILDLRLKVLFYRTLSAIVLVILTITLIVSRM